MRKKAGKAVIYFLVLMLCCTVIARAASSITTAKVKTGKSGRGVLTQTVTGSGTVTAKEQFSQSLPKGQKIQKILVKPQTEVEAGQALIQLDMEYLGEKIEEKNREIEKLNLQLQQLQTEGQEDARTPETAQAEIALNSAKQLLEQAQAAYDEAAAEYGNLTGNPPDEDADRQWEQQAQAAWEKLQGAADALDSQTIAYNQTVDQYNLAVQNESYAQQNEEKKKKANALNLESMQVDIDGAGAELKKLTDIQGTGGIVSADTSGIFQSAGAEEGAETAGTEQIVLDSRELEAKGEIASEDAGKIQEGDKIDLIFAGQKETVTVKADRLGQASSQEVQLQKEEPPNTGTMVWYGSLEGSRQKIGTAFTYEAKKESGTYEQVIPLSALHESQGKAYVYTAEMKEGILGEAFTVVSVPVTIQEKDEENAAIKASIDQNSLIITESSKYVEEGDPVRLESER